MTKETPPPHKVVDKLIERELTWIEEHIGIDGVLDAACQVGNLKEKYKDLKHWAQTRDALSYGKDPEETI